MVPLTEVQSLNQWTDKEVHVISLKILCVLKMRKHITHTLFCIFSFHAAIVFFMSSHRSTFFYKKYLMYFNSKIIETAQKTIKICSMPGPTLRNRKRWNFQHVKKRFQTTQTPLVCYQGNKTTCPFLFFKFKFWSCPENFNRFIYNKLNY